MPCGALSILVIDVAEEHCHIFAANVGNDQCMPPSRQLRL